MGIRAFFKEHQSVLTALVIATAVVAWMTSGGERQAAAPEPLARGDANNDGSAHVMSVRVRSLAAEPVSKEVIISGRTEPLREVTLRAEIEGRVTSIAAERGAAVTAGDIIARLDARDRAAQLQEAEAAIEQRNLEYQAAKNLREKNFQTETQVAQALANLEAARAQRERIAVELTQLDIRAPFDGVIEDRLVEKGDFVKVGDPVARVLDVDTILVVGNVSQGEVGDLRPGQHGTARLVTGESVTGRLRFVSMQSGAESRSAITVRGHC
jgi:multidrug efflux system membrane fusion protein